MARFEINNLQRALLALLVAFALCLLIGPIDLQDLSLWRITGDDVSRALHNAALSHTPSAFRARSNTSTQARRRADSSDLSDSDTDESDTELAAPVEFKLTEDEKTKAYHDYGCRGASLLEKLGDPTTMKPSIWTQYSDIATWGWTIDALSTAQGAPPRAYGLKDVLDAIGASEDKSHNADVRWTHNTETTRKDGARDVVYPPTWAQYENMFNARDGVIISYNNVGPRFRVTGKADGDVPADRPLPKLAQWSDLVWLTWLHSTDATNRNGVKHFIRTGVINPYSHAIAEKAVISLGAPNGRLKNFPGHKFTRSNDKNMQAAFEALVGSPNVNGIAWFLMQHFEAAGRKTIESVTIWNPAPLPAVPALTNLGFWNENMNMLIELGPAQDGPGTRLRSRL